MTEQTPEQITKLGHIVIALRKYLEEKDMNVSNFNRAMGYEAGYAPTYNVVNGKIAPGRTMRERITKVTGIPELELMPRETTAVTVIPKGPVGKMLDQLQRSDVLSFTINGNGEARIKLDVTLPIESAKPLFRLLLDAGVGT